MKTYMQRQCGLDATFDGRHSLIAFSQDVLKGTWISNIASWGRDLDVVLGKLIEQLLGGWAGLPRSRQQDKVSRSSLRHPSTYASPDATERCSYQVAGIRVE
jgi:hypothetical protein